MGNRREEFRDSRQLRMGLDGMRSRSVKTSKGNGAS